VPAGGLEVADAALEVELVEDGLDLPVPRPSLSGHVVNAQAGTWAFSLPFNLPADGIPAHERRRVVSLPTR
jgi:hypothetical protein